VVNPIDLSSGDSTTQTMSILLNGLIETGGVQKSSPGNVFTPDQRQGRDFDHVSLQLGDELPSDGEMKA
jgi:hypothetical protein